ncbi:piezo-type mechanosensitive ion channel component 2-like [Pseudonaja textilis]|uniref:piezo-type mechanosensitive ion channel component 2-like n=1 Tax=Pseudonaja textilis TaxID=8673 RepID=UPI000EA9D24F|nr:piezo-type mechanosensitive ion channel component 2-like [Pseudonaja textilis]
MVSETFITELATSAEKNLGCTGHLLRTISYTSFIFLMLQVSFQIAFYYLPPNDFFWEEVLSHFGIVRFSRLDAGNIIHLLAPDIGMFLFGLTVMLLCRKTVKLNNWESELPSGDHDQFSSDEEEDMKETESEAETEDTEDIDIGCLFEKDCLRCCHSGFLLKFTLFLTDLEILCEDTLRTAGKVFIMLLLGSTEHTIYSETSQEVNEKCNMEKKSSAFLALAQFIANQSYVIALITMMVWSITYNSWLTFVLLIWSCIIWMVHDRHLYALRSLPFLVIYGNVLVILNFIVGLNLSQEELFPGVATSLLIDLDLKPYSLPCVHLGAKILYQLTFWLLLRQYVMQIQKQKEEEFLKEVIVHQTEMGTSQNPIIEILSSIFKRILVKYWIYFCSIMFFIVSFKGKVVLYKIPYVIFFLFCVALYQIHYEGWRRILKGFWLISVSYSMIILIALYTYQFEMVSDFFLKSLEISEERLKDVGLEWFNTKELFTKIILLCAFLLVCIVQLHYFHKDFLNITDLTNISVNPSSSSASDKQMEILVCLLANRVKETLQKLQSGLAPEPLQKSFPDGLDKSENTTENEVKRNKWAEEVDNLALCLLKIIAIAQDMQVFAWRFLELHILKIVSTCTIWITLQEVCLMNYVFFIVWTFAIPYSKFRLYASRICTFWSCVMVICKMLYQLKFIKPWNYSSNCTQVSDLHLNITYHSINVDELLEKSSLYVAPIDPALWIGGLMKCSDNIFLSLKNHLTILILMALEATVYRHQYFYWTQNQILPPVTGSLFNNIGRENLDEGLLNCIKYCLNYSFYKFGLEICFVAAVNVIGQRMDLYALIHASWLTYLLSYRQRKAIAQVWPKYCFFLASIVAFQYLLCIGLPPALCQDYPWRSSHWLFPSNLIKWLYLPDFAERPNTNFLLYDFLLLLFASLQWQVFEDEDQLVVRLQAGDNSEINQDLGPAGLSEFSWVPNFIHCRSYLDLMKVLIFKYLFWIALCLIFVTATARINIFSVGYFVACFYFMHFGRSLQLKPLRDILRPWDYLIGYTTLVITVKNLLAIGSCAYLNKLQINYCWLIQTFAMYCTIPGYEVDPPNNEICELPKNEAGILWDAVCFTFLLIQRRVFMSHYYLYIVTDLKATDFLASRAAEMFELKLEKKVTSRMEQDRKATEIMKKHTHHKYGNVVQIIVKKNKLKFQISCTLGFIGRIYAQFYIGDDTSEIEKKNKNNWWQPWVTHNSVIRSGSYCLFDTDSEDEEEHEHSEMKKKELFKKKTAWQLAYEASMRNTKSAQNMREQDEISSQKNTKEEERKNEQLPGIEKANVSLESSDENIEILASEEDLDKSESIVQRIINIIKLISILMHALMYGTIEALNSLVKDNLDIANALRMEKHILWQQMNEGNEVSVDMVLQHYRFENNQSVYGEYKAKVIRTEESQGKVSESPPTENTEPSSLQLRRASETDKDVMGTEKIEGENEKGALSQGFTLTTSCAEPAVLSSSPSEIQESADSLFTRSPKANKPLGEISPMMTTSELVLNSILHNNELEQSDKFYQCLPCPLKLGVALYHVMVSTSEMLCYFVIIINHMVSASILTSVLSILIFLWPMLSIPRPTKFFWMIAIIYTELYCSINAEAPFALPNLIGMEKKDGYAQYDLVQLLALFLHRYILKLTPSVLWIYRPIKQFFYDIIYPKSSPVCDIYGYIFIADVINFIITIFGYGAFGKHSEDDFAESLLEDEVPVPWLVILLIQFGTMIIDRALYLRKNTFGKCVFQMILVFGVHIWMCFILPQVTQRRFNRNRLAQVWYLVKCIYFGLSAYQIKCGYANRTTGHFLTKNYNYINLYLFQGFRVMPFLIELKAAMDWIWTDSTLSLSSWICLEDIYANIFILKCQRECEKKYPQPPGQKKKPISASYFIDRYSPEDIVIAKIKGNASLLWSISPGNRKAMIAELSNSSAVYVNFHWTLTSILPGVLPKYLRATNQADAKIANSLKVEQHRHLFFIREKVWETEINLLSTVHSQKVEDIDAMAFFRNITIKLQRLPDKSSSHVSEWWIVKEQIPLCLDNRCSKNMEIIICNDKVSPSGLGFITGYGIAGLYMSFVLVIGKFIRQYFNGLSRSIMFEELPNVDRILKLCTDIFLAREAGELELEEQLFAKLIFLYRSPETMIKWTRERKEK